MLRVLEEQEARPRAQDRAGVLAGEHDGEEEPGDDLVVERAPIRVAGLEQRLEKVLSLADPGAPLSDEPADQSPTRRRARSRRRSDGSGR